MEWGISDQEGVCQTAKRPEVALWTDLDLLEGLWARGVSTANEGATLTGERLVLCEDLRSAEIGHFDTVLLVKEDVFGFQVTVEDPVLVDAGKGEENLAKDGLRNRGIDGGELGRFALEITIQGEIQAVVEITGILE